MVDHLVRGEHLRNQHRASDEEPDARIARREQDACVGHSSVVQSQMIGVGGDQDRALRRREGKERSIGGPELLCFSGC